MKKLVIFCVVLSSYFQIQTECKSHQNEQLPSRTNQLSSPGAEIISSSPYYTRQIRPVDTTFPSRLTVPPSPPPFRVPHFNNDPGLYQFRNYPSWGGPVSVPVPVPVPSSERTSARRTIEKKDKKNKELDEEQDYLRYRGMDDKELKELYKLSFYFNPGWYVRHPELPSGPGPVLSGEYFPDPQYGVLHIQHLPPPLPPKLSKSISPLVSNFGGYVGPIVYDGDDGLIFENPKW